MNEKDIIQEWELKHSNKIYRNGQVESFYNVYDRYWRRWVFLAGFDTEQSAEMYAYAASRMGSLTAIIPYGNQITHIYIDEELVWSYDDDGHE